MNNMNKTTPKRVLLAVATLAICLVVLLSAFDIFSPDPAAQGHQDRSHRGDTTAMQARLSHRSGQPSIRDLPSAPATSRQSRAKNATSKGFTRDALNLEAVQSTSFHIEWGSKESQMNGWQGRPTFPFGVDGHGRVFIFDYYKEAFPSRFLVFDKVGNYVSHIPLPGLLVRRAYVHPDGLVFTTDFEVDITTEADKANGVRRFGPAHRAIRILDLSGRIVHSEKFADFHGIHISDRLVVRDNRIFDPYGFVLGTAERLLGRALSEDRRWEGVTQTQLAPLGSENMFDEVRLGLQVNDGQADSILLAGNGTSLLARVCFLGRDLQQTQHWVVEWTGAPEDRTETPGKHVYDYTLLRRTANGVWRHLSLPDGNRPLVHQRCATPPFILAPTGSVCWITTGRNCFIFHKELRGND